MANATKHVRVGTGVTCPILRTPPALVAHAAATAALLFEGRFFLGVGAGEALNEHVMGQYWPPVEIRHEMLAEALKVMRELWKGDVVDFHGTYFTVENARIYDAPDDPIPVVVSAFGPKAAEVAAKEGDGIWMTSPRDDVLKAFADAAGRGPRIGQVTVCWAPSKEEGLATVKRVWPNTGLPGQLAQDLPTPSHFEQAAELVRAGGPRGQGAVRPRPRADHREAPRVRGGGTRPRPRAPGRPRPGRVHPVLGPRGETEALSAQALRRCDGLARRVPTGQATQEVRAVAFIYPESRYYYDWYGAESPPMQLQPAPMDSSIKAAVVDRLRNNLFTKDCELRVDVKRGVVILAGVVDSRLAKRSAGDDCWDTVGVTDVSNQLEVAEVPTDLGPQPISDIMTTGVVALEAEAPLQAAAAVDA